MKRKTLISSILVIVLCLGLISGSTFALFTSESSVNIAITSGKVNVTAAIKDLTLYSATANKAGLTEEELADEAGTLTGTFAGTYYYDKLTGTTFTNGGTATLSTDTKTLTLDKVTPGDKVKLTVDITNNSNVAIQYRIRVNALDTGINSANSYKLFKGLSVLIGSAATDLNSTIRVSDWTSLAGNTAIDDIPVEIALPLEAGNEYQELTTKIQITVEAVQGNGNTAKLKEINAILSASDKKNNTMYDAIQEVVTGSTYTYDDLKGYVWSVDNDLFYAEEDVEESFEYRFFKVYAAMPDVQTYSIYADTTWATAAVTGLTVGFDAGETSNITSVTYDRSTATDERDVVIRTNSSGTAVTINAPLDVVNHYGTAGTMNIIAVANQSHHEYGSVGFLEIKTGHVSLEKDSDVSKIHFDATVVSTTDKVFNNIIVSYDSSLSSSLPSFSRDDVAIPESGKLVVELQKVETSQTATSTTSDFIWLTKQGIFEQIKVSDNNESIENAKWADDSEVVPQTQTAAKEIANNIGRDTTTNEIQVELTVTNGSETKTYKVALDANRDLIVVDTANTSTPVATINDSGNVTINSVEYKVELSADSNKTELKATNKTNADDIQKTDAITSSGLTEAEKQSTKDSIINAVAKIGAAYYATLQAAFEASNNDVIIILENCELSSAVIISNSITIDLNGKQITTTAKYPITILANKKLTINDSLSTGSIIQDNLDGDIIDVCGVLEINGGTLSTNGRYGVIWKDKNGSVTINAGKYSNDVTSYVASGLECEFDTSLDLYKVGPIVLAENTLSIDSNGYYQVYNYEDLVLVSKLVKQGVEDFDEKTIILMSSIDLSEVYWSKIGFSSGRTFKGTFDGNGKTITLGNNINLFGYLDHSTIKNLNVFFNNSNNSHIAYSTGTGTVFNNVDVSGVIHFASGNQAAYVVYPDGDSLSFVNCDSSLTIVGTGDATVYIALYMGYPCGSNMTIQFDSCINNGSISSGRAALYIANGSYGMGVDLVLNNCENNGVVQYFADISEASIYSAQAATPNYYYAMPADRPGTLKSVTIDGTKYTNWGSLAASDHPGTGSLLTYESCSNLTITMNEDKTFTITPSTNEKVAYYLVTVGTYFTVPGGSNRYYVTENITIEGDSKTTTIKNIQFVDRVWVESNPTALEQSSICGNTTYILNDTLYYLLDYENGSFNDHLPHNPEMISVSGYSSEGILLCAASYK